MRSYLPIVSLAAVALSTLTSLAALPDSVVIVPKPSGDFSVINDETDPLAKCPRYETDHMHQVLKHGGWEGKDDYRAVVRFALSGDQLIARIDVTDDLTRVDPTGVSGDRIAIRSGDVNTTYQQLVAGSETVAASLLSGADDLDEASPLTVLLQPRGRRTAGDG